MNRSTVTLHPATPDDIPLLRHIAYNTWPATFRSILSQAQIDYMLKWMYSEDTLADHMKNPNFLYYLINDDGGLTAMEVHFEESNISKLHKLYILPEHQGKGWGAQSVRELESISRQVGDRALILNVNKNNPATHFYEKCGFERWKSEVINIGEGYVMDDYIYRKRL